MAIRTQSALDRLSPPAHARILELSRTMDFETGAAVLREGADTPFLGELLEGRIALRLRIPERGARMTIVTIEPGNLLGWSAVVPPYRATVDAIATERSQVLAIDAVALRERLAGDPELAAELLPLVLEAVSTRLSAGWQQLVDVFGPGADVPW